MTTIQDTATFVFKAQVQTLGGYGPVYEDIEYVITLDTTSFAEANARAVFHALYPNLKINRVLEFRRITT